MKTLVVLCATLLSMPAARATTMFSVTGTSDGNVLVGSNSAASEGWTQSGTYTGVSISATVFNQDSVSHTLNAYLTNQVGPGTTAVSNEIANGSAVIAGSSEGAVLFFSGLTLAPGTYYLTLSSSEDFLRWRTDSPETVTTAPGVSALLPITVGANPGYAPAHDTTTTNAEDGAIAVTGTLSATTPEPTYWPMLSVALAGLWRVRKTARS